VLVPALALAASLGAGAALAAPTLLPTAATSSSILRDREPPESTTETHLPLGRAILAVVPDATGNPADHVVVGAAGSYGLDTPFVGVVALVLAAGAVLAAPVARTLGLAAASTAAAVLASTGPGHRLLYEVLPGYDRFRASSRWLAVLPVFLLPLAALGLDRMAAQPDRRVRVAMGAAAAAAAVAALIWYLAHGRSLAAPAGYLGLRVAWAVGAAALAGVAALLARRPGLALGLVAATIVAEVALHTPRWFPALEEAQGYPAVAVGAAAEAHGGRLIRVSGERSPIPSFGPVLPLAYGLADAQGQAVLFPADYDRLLRLVDDYGEFAVATNTAPALLGASGLASPVLDALDVRTVVADSNIEVAGLALV
ncbi:MAG: hypothetical protein ACRD0F_09595, partial [Acidimicrobiales bacterium]